MSIKVEGLNPPAGGPDQKRNSAPSTETPLFTNVTKELPLGQEGKIRGRNRWGLVLPLAGILGTATALVTDHLADQFSSHFSTTSPDNIPHRTVYTPPQRDLGIPAHIIDQVNKYLGIKTARGDSGAPSVYRAYLPVINTFINNRTPDSTRYTTQDCEPTQEGTSFPAEIWDFGNDVSEQDRLTITNAIGGMKEFLSNVLCTTLSNTVTVSVRAAAFGGQVASDRGITLRTLEPGWINSDEARRQRVAAHEYFHVWQLQTVAKAYPHPARPGPMWLSEGSANYLASKFIDHKSLMTYADMRRCFIWRVGPGNPSLNNLESPEAFLSARPYSLASIAVDKLAENKGDFAIINYYQMLGQEVNQDTAFYEAFGTNLDTFYQNFEQWRKTLSRPSGDLNFSCAGY